MRGCVGGSATVYGNVGPGAPECCGQRRPGTVLSELGRLDDPGRSFWMGLPAEKGGWRDHPATVRFLDGPGAALCCPGTLSRNYVHKDSPVQVFRVGLRDDSRPDSSHARPDGRLRPAQTGGNGQI